MSVCMHCTTYGNVCARHAWYLRAHASARTRIRQEECSRQRGMIERIMASEAERNMQSNERWRTRVSSTSVTAIYNKLLSITNCYNTCNTSVTAIYHLLHKSMSYLSTTTYASTSALALSGGQRLLHSKQFFFFGKYLYIRVNVFTLLQRHVSGLLARSRARALFPPITHLPPSRFHPLVVPPSPSSSSYLRC